MAPIQMKVDVLSFNLCLLNYNLLYNNGNKFHIFFHLLFVCDFYFKCTDCETLVQKATFLVQWLVELTVLPLNEMYHKPCLVHELRHEETCFLHMQKQRYRSAVQRLCFSFIDSIVPLLLKSESSSL